MAMAQGAFSKVFSSGLAAKLHSKIFDELAGIQSLPYYIKSEVGAGYYLHKNLLYLPEDFSLYENLGPDFVGNKVLFQEIYSTYQPYTVEKTMAPVVTDDSVVDDDLDGDGSFHVVETNAGFFPVY